jgi:hypothetical protein
MEGGGTVVDWAEIAEGMISSTDTPLSALSRVENKGKKIM